MQDPASPDAARPEAAPAAPPVPGPVWERFHDCIRHSLALRPRMRPMPDWEDHGDSAVRAMQRARRHTWLYARHGLGWSMFESIRIAVCLGEAFAEWTRESQPELDELARRLRGVEDEARRPVPPSMELRFVDQLMSTATSTDLHLAEMEFALEAYRRSVAA